jgi:hypothetical protein
MHMSLSRGATKNRNRNAALLQEEALYYTFNGTETPTGNEQLSLTHTKVIFNITGSMATPVKNVAIRGLTIRDAAFTYLGTDEASRHWLPSEGDWALQRSGAIHIEGAEGITIDRNQLTRNDGNAIFLGGYSRGVNITANDFNWIGDSVIAAFGWTSDCLHADCAVKLPAKVGPDGRGGEQPRNAYIGGNLFRYVNASPHARTHAHTTSTSTRAPTQTFYFASHCAQLITMSLCAVACALLCRIACREFGIWQKQSSALFLAIAALFTFESNVPDLLLRIA